MWDDFSTLSIVGVLWGDSKFGLVEITMNSCTMFLDSVTSSDDFLIFNKSLIYIFDDWHPDQQLKIYEYNMNSPMKEILTFNNSRYLESFVGHDLNPYVRYITNGSFNHLLQIQSRLDTPIQQYSRYTKVLVDEFSTIHYVVHSKLHNYIQIKPGGEVKKEVTLDAINENATVTIRNMFNSTFLIGDYYIYFGDEGLFLVDTRTGSLVFIHENLITNIETTNFSILSGFGSVLVVLSIKLKQRKDLKK